MSPALQGAAAQLGGHGAACLKLSPCSTLLLPGMAGQKSSPLPPILPCFAAVITARRGGRSHGHRQGPRRMHRPQTL